MRGLIQVVGILGTVALSVAGVTATPAPLPADDHGSIVIIFKDGHRQSFAVGEMFFSIDRFARRIVAIVRARIQRVGGIGIVPTIGRRSLRFG